jgi:hypothetical protein
LSTCCKWTPTCISSVRCWPLIARRRSSHAYHYFMILKKESQHMLMNVEFHPDGTHVPFTNLQRTYPRVTLRPVLVLRTCLVTVSLTSWSCDRLDEILFTLRHALRLLYYVSPHSDLPLDPKPLSVGIWSIFGSQVV